jgi:hypothetical protein
MSIPQSYSFCFRIAGSRALWEVCYSHTEAEHRIDFRGYIDGTDTIIRFVLIDAHVPHIKTRYPCVYNAMIPELGLRTT